MILQNFDKVIKQVKRSTNNNQILNSTNKTKTTLNIINYETDRNDQNSRDGDVSDKIKLKRDSFSDYFLSLAKKITDTSNILI